MAKKADDENTTPGNLAHFVGLLYRGLFRNQSNIKDGDFHENS